ncbi:MAG: DUF1566 domain-containing protein [Spirochaetia bacterium]
MKRGNLMIAVIFVLPVLIGIGCSLDGPAGSGNGSGGASDSEQGAAGLPKTGQTVSYAVGDDGNLERGVAWPEPRFTNHADGTITDRLTGLMWQREPLETGRTWTAAVDYCNSLELAGRSDWRLPNRTELMSLFHFGVDQPYSWLGGQGFGALSHSPYWSGTRCGEDPDRAWTVSLTSYLGNIQRSNKGDENRAMAVRTTSPGVIGLPRTGQDRTDRAGDDGNLQEGRDWPDPRFTDNGDGTITDELTGLMWQRSPVADEKTWENAIGYCNGLWLSGRFDWRLPNVLELASLYNARRDDNHVWLNDQGFVGIQDAVYCSSTSLSADHEEKEYAWMMNAGSGVVVPLKKTVVNTWNVIAVRGGE